MTRVYLTNGNYLTKMGLTLFDNKLVDIYQKFLEKIEVKNSRELTRALVKNLRHLQRFKNYYKVVEPLKEGKFLEALQALNIDFLLLFLQRIPTLL